MTRKMRDAFYNDQFGKNVDLVDQIAKKQTDRMSKRSSDMVSKITADRTTISKR